jgi:DNA-binding response OmpR family regulator
MARVLVVDDEQRICRFVARALEASGFQVDMAMTGAAVGLGQRLSVIISIC